MAIGDGMRALAQRVLQMAVRAPRVAPPKPQGGYALGRSNWGVMGERRGARQLRMFSERDVWVRTAINRRKREIARAEWTIVRIDDKHAQPDPKIVKAATDLFTFVNDTKISLDTLLGMMVEDILVLDAGCVEIERTYGGKIAALWPVLGEEIVPDPMWDGSEPKKPRYYQLRDGHEVAQYLNNELMYVMANPRSCSAVGLSPLQVLIATVEADLYGETFEYQTLRETAPSGIMFLGGAVPPEKVASFREQWEIDMAGGREIVFLGGGGFDPESGTMGQPPNFIPLRASAKDEQRREYMKWLATKVAAAFEMDLLAFNLSESIHKSIGSNLQSKTDEGLLGLGSIIEKALTREILWDIDPTHRHGFKFKDLTRRDERAKADVRKIYMSIGATTPNEIRKEDGLLPVPWGDVPWPSTTFDKSLDPAADIESESDGETPADADPQPENKPGGDDEQPDN